MLIGQLGIVELDGDHCARVLEGCEQRDLGPELELLGDHYTILYGACGESDCYSRNTSGPCV